MIDSAEIVRETRDGRMLDIEITLSDWVFDAIENNHVLTLNRGYFFLRKPLERRVYELARKHCGQQQEWRVGLETLREKCGSGSSEKEFKRLVGKIVEDDARYDHMPDYTFMLDDEIIIVRPKQDPAQVPQFLPSGGLRLDPGSHDKARQAAPGWDVHVLEAEWRSWVLDKGIAVRDADAHFLGFCRNRGPYRR